MSFQQVDTGIIRVRDALFSEGGSFQAFTGGSLYNTTPVNVSSGALKDRLIINTNAGATAWTLPTGGDLTASFGNLPTFPALPLFFDVLVCNRAAATITITGNTNMTVAAGSQPQSGSFTIRFVYAGGDDWAADF